MDEVKLPTPDDKLRIHCPVDGQPLTTSIGGDDSQPLESAQHIICLSCPHCGVSSVVVLNMHKLLPGGASR